MTTIDSHLNFQVDVSIKNEMLCFNYKCAKLYMLEELIEHLSLP